MVRHFDLASTRWVRAVFDLRTLPDRLRGRAVAESDRRLGVDQITGSRKPGFMLLEEIPGREVVIGAIGQFWHLNIPFLQVPPGQFRDFREAGWGKIAWSLSVEPFGTGSTVSLELRTTANDGASWSRFRRYYRIIGPVSRLIRTSSMARFEAELGRLQRDDDDRRPLPGDEQLPAAPYQLTHALDIEAPPRLVWRYLMQLGCDRAGWYSIDALDHGGMPSVDHLIDGWEMRQAGDRLAATPAQDSFFEVYRVDPEYAFVIGGETTRLGGPFRMTWAFVLEPVGSDATHLIVRVRMAASPRWAAWVQGALVFPPVHRLMQRRQLHTLRRLCERDAQQREFSMVGI